MIGVLVNFLNLIMNLIFWNIRGLGKGEKVKTIRKLVGNYNISFLGLVETKHRVSIKNGVKRLWGYDNFDMCEVFASETFAGGIITIWDASSFNVAQKHKGGRWIILEGSIVSSNFNCCVGVLYGPIDRLERWLMFEEIKHVVSSINKPMLLLGDFNTILYPDERVGTFRCDLSSRDFSDWIQDLGLVDLPLYGIKFTWRRNASKSRLDRGLCRNMWLR